MKRRRDRSVNDEGDCHDSEGNGEQAGKESIGAHTRVNGEKLQFRGPNVSDRTDVG